MARDRPSPDETRRGVRHVSRLLAIRRAQTTEVSVGKDRPIFTRLFAIGRTQTTEGRTAAWRGTGPRPTKHGGVSETLCSLVSVGKDRPISTCLLAIGRSQTTDGRTAAWRGTGPRPTKHGAESNMSRVCLRSGDRKLQKQERRHGEGQALALRNTEGCQPCPASVCDQAIANYKSFCSARSPDLYLFTCPVFLRSGDRKLQMDEWQHGEGQALALRNTEGCQPCLAAVGD